MARKKKISFKLDPEWLLKEPVDFEYNKYTLLNYLQKCENGFNKLELYPDFVEISLHLANLQTLSSDKKILLTDKKFDSCDDEILVKELTHKPARELNEEEEKELEKTIKYSGSKLFDAFNMGKAIWNLAFDNVEVTVRRNKTEMSSGFGHAFYWRKDINMLYVWEYSIKPLKDATHGGKIKLNLIHEAGATDMLLTEIIQEKSTFNRNILNKDLPIFEVKSSNVFPMEQTLVPMIKRKILSIYYQVVTFEKITNFEILP